YTVHARYCSPPRFEPYVILGRLENIYGHEGTTSETRSDAVSLNNLAAEVAEITALLRENTQAVVALTDKRHMAAETHPAK
ncbi:hypothetical protein V5799_018315, partial [Amblyomma americanum]